MPKINVANPELGLQKTFEIEDEHKLMPFWDKRMGAEVPADSLGAEWKGYVLRITGGNDKQGFPMKQGVLKNGRVRLLFKNGMSCYRERRAGMRKRKSVRGCIVGHDLAIMNVIVVKKGEADIEGITGDAKDKRLGPKRASRIRRMFALEKEDDVKKFVVRRVFGEDGKKNKAAKIQRLVTDSRLKRKRTVKKQMIKKVQQSRADKKEYQKVIHDYRVALKEKKQAESAKKKKEQA